MAKFGVDQQALVAMFTEATAKGSEQLRKSVGDATLAALQGRELTLKNIRGVLKSVAEAASAAAEKAQMPGMDVEALLERSVAGMDDALLRAVEANRLALQQFVAQGADLREKHLQKALSDLEHMEDTFLGAVRKATEAANAQVAAQWAPVLEKMQAGGTLSGQQAATAAEQFTQQMQTAVRDSRAASIKAAQAMAESYAALVSGVLIGLSEAMQQGAAAAPAKAARKR